MKVLHSIKGKLILFTLCISLIPISIITSVYYLNARSTFKERILQELTAIAESKKIHTLSFMEAKRGRTIDFSSDGFIRDSLEIIVQRGTQSHAVANLNNHLKVNKKPIDPHITEIAIIGRDGIVVSSTNEKIIGNDVSKHEMFVKSINNKFGETYVGRTNRSPYFKGNCIFISAPLTSKRNDKGATIGVIISAYDLASLNEITANRIGMGKTGEVYLVNRDKVMITESRFIADTVLRQVVDTEPVERTMSGDRGVVGIFRDYRGERTVVAAVDLPEYGWALLAEKDKAEVFEPLRRLGIIALVVGGLSGGVTIILGIVFSLSAIKPITNLKDATERFGKGDLDYRLNVGRKDEIGVLAGSFNSMAEEIKTLTDSLEKRINERTWKLSRTNEKLLREISWRIRTEEELRKLSCAVEQSPVDVIITNVKGDIEYVNPKFTQSTGYTYEEVVGQNLRILKSGKQSPEIYKGIWEKISSGGEWHGELRNKKKNGELFWVTASISPIKNADGIITHFIGVQEDTTVRKRIEEELKDFNASLEKHVVARTADLAKANKKLRLEIDERIQAEKALHDSEEKLRAIVDNTTAVIYIKDLQGRYILVNSQYETIFHVSKNEIVGKTAYDIFPKDRADAFSRNDKAVIEAVTNMEFEEIISLDDGLHTYISIKFPLFDTKSAIYAVCTISTDITERRKIENELVKAQKLESIGVLAGGIAHDFNNYLQAILGYISLAKTHTNANDNIYKYLEEAGKAVYQSTGLTHQLLTFSKGGEPVKSTVCVSELIRDSAKLALSGSNLICEFEISEDLWIIDADRGQLNQVISNLIINANQAMPEGGSIKVMAENIYIVEKDLLPLQEGRYVKITVKDHGSGISQENLQKIFDPYFTTKQKGSGLGLATTYSIISKHDGYITVESETGVGTTFHIYLPASQKEFQQESTLSKVDGSGLDKKHLEQRGAAGTDVSRGKVLLMDDQYTIRTVLCEHLRSLKYEVEAVGNGSEAIRLYKDAIDAGKPFDAVIMDLTITGGMGGKETIKKLLEIDPEVRAIVSSGYANDPIMANYLKYGFKGVLAKPHEIHELDETLQRVVTVVN